MNFIRFKQHSSSREANHFILCQEISHILINMSVHYLDYKNLSFASIQHKINLIHPIYFKIHCNVILSSMPRSSKWSHFFRFPTKLLYAFLNSPMCAMCCPAHLFLLKLITVIISGEKYSHETPQYVVFSSIWLLPLSLVQLVENIKCTLSSL